MTIDTKRSLTQAAIGLAVILNGVLTVDDLTQGLRFSAAVHSALVVALLALSWVLDHVHALYVARVAKAQAEAAIGQLAQSQWERHVSPQPRPSLDLDARRRAH